MLTDDDLGDLVRLLMAKTPLGELSWMQAETVFKFLEQRGYRIVRPKEEA